jgi:bifunctional NMN adenylyltransferase/nudix hydrolase
MDIQVIGAQTVRGAIASHALGVFIGRFQPFHYGHLFIIKQALKQVKYLTILVGSSSVPRSYFNPFTFEEREAMILSSLTEEEQARVFIQPLVDMTYNDGAWVRQVQSCATDAVYHFGLGDIDKPSVALVGHSKDGSSFYLKMFPQWAEIALPNHYDISATPIREKFFSREAFLELLEDIAPVVPAKVRDFMANFSYTADYNNMVEEYEYVQRYRKQFEGLSYPPIFQTVDAVVVQSGHILLVKRKSRPGKGLWALPGGFLNATERVQDAVYRELREETKIKVPEAVLRGSTITSKLFDDVHRSARGRTLTHAFLIKLPDGPLPRVKGADDAEKAKWVPISEVTRDVMFEDHHAIITNLTALL